MVLNIAHRGASSIAPENTVVAARKALEFGADLWETDVTVTADGELVLIHDDTLIRTTDAGQRFPDRSPWACRDFTLEEIRSLDAGSWFVQSDPFGQITSGVVTPTEQAAYAGEKVPTLKESLIFTQETGWRINLEIKQLPPGQEGFPVVERTLATIYELGIDIHRVVLSSFHHEYLREVRALNSSIAVQALVRNTEFESLDWDNLEFEAYNIQANPTTEAQVRTLKAKDVTVNIFTVDRKADMQCLIAAGVDGLFTNFPQRLVALQRTL